MSEGAPLSIRLIIGLRRIVLISIIVELLCAERGDELALTIKLNDCLPQLFHNHIVLKETSGGVVPLRFTSEQLAVYESFPNYRLRSLCPAGICIDVWTDASRLTIDAQIINRARKLSYFDLFVNNERVQSARIYDSENSSRYDFDLRPTPGVLNRITLYLPHNMEMILHDLVWTGGSRIEAVQTPLRKLLCLGDSITQGMTADHPSCTYPVLLARQLDMHLLNQGVGGYYFEADSLDPDLPFTPDLITVAYGTNDWNKWTSTEELFGRVTEYLRKLTKIYTTSRVFVITPLWRTDWLETKRTGTFEQMTETIESACGLFPEVRLIQGFTLIPHEQAMFADHVHPNEVGFDIMARILGPMLEV